MTWSLMPLLSSTGSFTMRNLAVSCGEGVSHEKSGVDRCGFESFFILSNASWWSFKGRLNAFAIDWYVMSSWLARHVRAASIEDDGAGDSRGSNATTGDDKVVLLAHPPTCLGDFILVIADDLHSLQVYAE